MPQNFYKHCMPAAFLYFYDVDDGHDGGHEDDDVGDGHDDGDDDDGDDDGDDDCAVLCLCSSISSHQRVC